MNCKLDKMINRQIIFNLNVKLCKKMESEISLALFPTFPETMEMN